MDSFEERFQVSVGGSKLGTSQASLGPFRVRLIFTDLAVIAVSISVGLLVSSRESAWGIDPLLAIYGTPVAIAIAWFLLLLSMGSYDLKVIGLGTEEARRAMSATLLTFAVVAGISYLIRADISRAYAFISLPLGLILIITTRVAWRKWLYRQRSKGNFMYRTVVIGGDSIVFDLTNKLNEDAYCGYQVFETVSLPTTEIGKSTLWLQALEEILSNQEVDAVAIAPGDESPHDLVKQLAWHLEGRKIDLLISPGILDLAGPRLSVRPASGLPLLHLDTATLSRPQRALKRITDISVSLGALTLLSPVLLAAGLTIRLTSRGPIFFKQVRVGRSGAQFTIYKFRTMYVDSDLEREQLRVNHSLHEPLFKLSDDPRITKVGKFLRRWSIDEIPQFFNVLGGSMSVVGPRPHPMDDVNRYEVEAYRRLALKPGITGLWQVSGRSSLDWAHSLELDMYYIERWSMLGDFLLMLRTLRIVLRGTGAV
jgi:exopolysaccharide biosynthesis polyprenyl glycosylphosphotransferase